MKPPIKPFLVEVKRSRSSSSTAEAVRVQRPLVVEASEPAPAAPYSEARKLAERAFKAFATAPVDEHKDVLTAESVFLPNKMPGAAPRILQTEPTPLVADDEHAKASVAVPPKPRKPRARRVSVQGAAVALGFEADVSDTSTADVAPVTGPSGAHGEQQLPVAAERVQNAAVHEPVVEGRAKKDPLQSDPRSEAGHSTWSPGERWKRRLRHLR